MDVRPGNRIRAMQRLRQLIEDDPHVNLDTFVIFAESKSGGHSTAYWIVAGRDGGSEAAAYTLLQVVPPEAMDTIYPLPSGDDGQGEYVEDDDEDDAGQ